LPQLALEDLGVTVRDPLGAWKLGWADDIEGIDAELQFRLRETAIRGTQLRSAKRRAGTFDRLIQLFKNKWDELGKLRPSRLRAPRLPHPAPYRTPTVTVTVDQAATFRAEAHRKPRKLPPST
jgi:hypothetical protein